MMRARRIYAALLVAFAAPAVAASDAVDRLQLLGADDPEWHVSLDGHNWRIPEACLMGRSFGADEEGRNLGAAEDGRLLGAGEDGRHLGDDEDGRLLGAAEDGRHLGADEDGRLHGSAVEPLGCRHYSDVDIANAVLIEGVGGRRVVINPASQYLVEVLPLPASRAAEGEQGTLVIIR